VAVNLLQRIVRVNQKYDLAQGSPRLNSIPMPAGLSENSDWVTENGGVVIAGNENVSSMAIAPIR
jgi:hypothetical protein